ncbi:glycosyltransferase family 4 protein [Aerosakkonema sp. BLCC-F183]|uniref:glycosyltransferase family 4 protein n=1 Tax=Aerosakkonema sp. BLCC-F183 TaxID=3342834 RepID=UPI0035B6B5A7
MFFDRGKQIVFISSCPEPWGGSEELWASAAQILAEKGQKVKAYKTLVVDRHSRILKLQSSGIPVVDIYRLKFSRQLRYLNRIIPGRWQFLPLDPIDIILAHQLKKLQPDLVVISQGENFDGLRFANICFRQKLSYVIICQKAVDCYWPHDEIRPVMQEVFRSAKRCFFVAEHNLLLTEAQIGEKLNNAEVVRNPYCVSPSNLLPWSDINDGLYLACVGRLFIYDKGQDILLRVLAQEKWKKRKLYVNFFGQGIHREALVGMAKYLNITNVSFPGFIEDITEVWRHHHALILPSRCEGLPLVLVEAMMCGRLGIVTDVGGIPEIIEDNLTGFLAAGANFHALDEAMERAWSQRYEWEKIGQKAARSIRNIIKSEPSEDFVTKLMEIIS